MNFLSKKGMIWPDGRVQGIIYFGDKGWKASAWYLKDATKTYKIGEGSEVLDRLSAAAKLDEVFDGWIQKQGRRR